jgi:hypothetical protein
MLELPVRYRGVQVGKPVDLLLGAAEWRAIGFEVACGDGERRFLPFATVRVYEGELAIGSALMLLAELDFYRARSRSFRSLVASPLELDGRVVELRDALVEPDGDVAELVVGAAGSEERIVLDDRQRRAAA